MIVPLDEQVISLNEAAKLLPRRRGGKRPHISCIYRWTVSGCKGVILESVQVGGTRCTSKQALGRFFERLSAAPHTRMAESNPQAEARRQHEIQAVDAELDLAGF